MSNFLAIIMSIIAFFGGLFGVNNTPATFNTDEESSIVEVAPDDSIKVGDAVVVSAPENAKVDAKIIETNGNQSKIEIAISAPTQDGCIIVSSDIETIAKNFDGSITVRIQAIDFDSISIEIE